jgi:hypothetical protein
VVRAMSGSVKTSRSSRLCVENSETLTRAVMDRMLAGVSTRRFSSRLSVYLGAFPRSAKDHPPVELRHAYHPRMNDVDRPRQPELDHLGLSVADLARSEEFYCDVLVPT